MVRKSPHLIHTRGCPGFGRRARDVDMVERKAQRLVGALGLEARIHSMHRPYYYYLIKDNNDACA